MFSNFINSTILGKTRISFRSRHAYSCQPVLRVVAFLMLIAAGIVQSVATKSSAKPFEIPAGTRAFNVGSIPPQIVRHGETLQFQVKVADAPTATYTLTLNPDYPVIPQGKLKLDSASGLFTYEPVTLDKFEFSLVFVGAVTGLPAVSQTVVITPLADLPSESDLLGTTRPTPDPESQDYQLVTQSLGKTKEMHNGVEQPLRDVQISCKRCVFADKDSKNTLYAQFNSAPDLKSLTIYAETLVIRSPLKLPGTNVTIYARELRFEDAVGEASLDTTPKNYLTGAVQFANGLHGQKGGDITLRIKSVYTDMGGKVRLIARGGDGQKAGEGRAGNPGSSPSGGYYPLRPESNKQYSNLWAYFQPYGGWTYPVIRASNQQTCQIRANALFQQVAYEEWSQPFPHAIYIAIPNRPPQGTQVWPGDGENGVVGGKPGNAGAGGEIHSSLSQVSLLSDQSAGKGGERANPQPGGAAGQPVRSVLITSYVSASGGPRTAGQGFYCATDEHTSKPGQPSIPLSADILVGAKGAFTALTGTDARWLHPALVRMVLAHAKDAYISGDFNYAKLVFSDYLDLLNNYGDAPDDDAALRIAQSKAEIEGYLQKLNSNLDYFGNPANWVPMLSLEATLKNFTNEVDASMLILYLQYWLENKAANNQKDVKALQDALNILEQDNGQIAEAVNNALESIPTLQFQAAELTAKLELLQEALIRKEAELEQRARNNVAARKKLPFWKRAVRVISTVLKLIPVKQPLLGTIGTGLDILTNIDTNKPLDTVKQLFDVSSIYSKSGYKEASEGLKGFLAADLKRAKNEKLKDYGKRLIEEGKKLEPAVKLIMQEFKTKQIDNAEVQREFEKIKAEDSEFNELIRMVNEVTAQKEVFVRTLADSMQQVTSGTNQISQNLLTSAAMYRQLDPAIAGFDHTTLLSVREMGRVAQERLLHYQYWMAKAYEYRMLKPYPGDYKLNQVTSRLVAMLGNNYTLNPADFAAIKAVYIASVREIVAAGLNELQKQPPERSLPFYFELTPEELKQLNQAGAVSIDLVLRIAGLPNEENRHIADLGVTDGGMQVHVNDAVSGFGRVRVVAEHNGQSLESAGGRSYRFALGAGLGNHPFTYGASYDVLSGRLDRETLSVAGLSLLQTLLGITAPVDSSSLALFVRPGADAKIRLLKHKDPANMDATIARLRMFVAVDFYRTASTQVWLNVQTPNVTTPYVVINQTDLAGRSDGRGSFRRAYRQGTAVRLIAEPVYGGMKFLHWTDQTGTVLATTPELSVTLDASRTVRAIYQAQTEQAPPTISGSTITLQQGSSATAQNIATVGAAQDALGSLSVAVTSAPTGITVGELANNNGTITATVTAACTAAATNAVSLKVTDSSGQTALATLTVNVTPNTPPKLGAYSATNVGSGGETIVTPSAAPEDNGSMSNLTAAVTPASFTGLVSVNPNTGAVTINNAGPVGSYTVTLKATDNCETVTTASFALTVNQSSVLRIIRVVAASGTPGGTVSIPIEAVLQGNENAIGFSINFDPVVLSNPQVGLGVGATGAMLNPNLSQIAQGKVGFAIAFPAGQTFSAGTRQVAVLTLAVAAATSVTSTPIAFGDQPVVREVADSSANTLSTNYENGVVTISTGYESDVAPRPIGNGNLTISDWTQVGRYIAGMDLPAPGGEFQRADCAPRSSLGNGALTISDWVQAGRYAAGLDPLTPVGGPTAPVSSIAQLTSDDWRQGVTGKMSRVEPSAIIRAYSGQGQYAITLALDAPAGVNAVGLSLIFNPSQWRFDSARLGNDATDATLNLNTDQASDGRLGLALALPVGQTFAAGIRQLVVLKFTQALNVYGQAPSLAVGFADTPVAREIATADANVLASSYAVESLDGAIGALANVSAASFRDGELAREQIVAAFGKNLAADTTTAFTLPLPTQLSGVRVEITDSRGEMHNAPLFFVAPGQVNYLIPATTSEGVATVTITQNGIPIAIGLTHIVAVAPALFTVNANGMGLPAAIALRVDASRVQSYETITRFDTVANRFVPIPINLGGESEIILILFGTGIQNRSASSAVTVLVGGTVAEVLFAGPQGDFVGLDQINVMLPRNLIGRGEVDVVVSVDGVTANPVRISIK